MHEYAAATPPAVMSLLIFVYLCFPLPPVVWLIRLGGQHFYVYVWFFLMVVSVVMMMIYPTLIAPLFNQYIKLEGGALYEAIEKLAKRVDFPLTEVRRPLSAWVASCLPHSVAYLSTAPLRSTLWTGPDEAPTPTRIFTGFSRCVCVCDHLAAVQFCVRLWGVCGVFFLQFCFECSRITRAFRPLVQSKRIVLFDTLIKQVEMPELLAILGHEIGHWKLGHTIQGFIISQASCLCHALVTACHDA